MSTVPTTPDDEDYPDPVGLAAAAARYLNKTGYPARITAANQDAVFAAARRLISALVPEEEQPLPGGGFISGPMIGGDR